MLSQKKQKVRTMKNKNMNSTKIKQFFIERNSSPNTQRNYITTIKLFEKVINKTIDETLTIATQEKNNIWEETQLYTWLILFRNHLYNNYKESSAKMNMARIKAIFHHFRIRTNELPYFSTKQIIRSDEIDYEDLPHREILKKCIELKNPLLKALTLFMSSTGISRTDTYNLTIQNYIDATREYHNTNDIHLAIQLMIDSKVDIIPTFKLKRKKTGETYRTFASPEAVEAVNLYLLTRENLTPEAQLFKINFIYLNTIFKETNDLLNLGQINGRSRFSPQMLRSYHATQLSEAGMNDNLIDLLQGRKPQSIARKSYIRVRREKLKEEYIRCLPFLVVQEIEQVKTELEVTKEELEVVTRENVELKSNIEGIWDVLNDVQRKQDLWDSLKKEE